MENGRDLFNDKLIKSPLTYNNAIHLEISSLSFLCVKSQSKIYANYERVLQCTTRLKRIMNSIGIKSEEIKFLSQAVTIVSSYFSDLSRGVL